MIEPHWINVQKIETCQLSIDYYQSIDEKNKTVMKYIK